VIPLSWNARAPEHHPCLPASSFARIMYRHPRASGPAVNKILFALTVLAGKCLGSHRTHSYS